MLLKTLQDLFRMKGFDARYVIGLRSSVTKERAPRTHVHFEFNYNQGPIYAETVCVEANAVDVIDALTEKTFKIKAENPGFDFKNYKVSGRVLVAPTFL